MKESIRFILIYSIVSIVLLVLLETIFHPLSGEIFSYTIWLYIFYTVIGVVVFLLFGFLLTWYKLSLYVRVLCYAVLCLFILNSVPLFGEKRFLTLDTIHGILVQKYEVLEIGIHVIALTSFVIAALFIFERNRVAQP